MVAKIDSSQLKVIVSSQGTPTYIYSESILTANVQRIKQAVANSGLQNRVIINASYFSNSNPHLFKILENLGVGATLQSVEENEQLKRYDLSIPRIVSPTHLSKNDLNYFLKEDIKINCPTLSNLEELINKRVSNISIRVDLSPESNQRQGFKINQFDEVRNILEKNNQTLYGIHIYPGTKNKLDVHLRYQIKSLECLDKFPSIKEINLGGGFNYDYESENGHFDWNTYFQELKRRVDEFKVPKEIEFSIEPGRDILSDAGTLIVGINGVEKVNGKNLYEIFTDSSYVQMPSATIGQRQHKLSFYNSNFQELNCDITNENTGNLSGNTTLSSDRLFLGAIYFPKGLKEGDYLLLHDVGAYCATQHMEFLNKSPCAEVLIDNNGKTILITQRGTLRDKIRYVLESPREIGTNNES